jgi:tetratricopeptide (TPR) repeat protein
MTSAALLAQDNPKSTFEEADLLIKQEKFSQAYILMKRYQTTNPNDFNAAWKTAQVAYWNWQVENAKLFYEIAIKLEPSNNDVKFDYAKMLFDVGDYKEAEVLFTTYRTANPSSAEAWIYSIKNLYFDKQLKKALDLYEQIPSSLGTNTDLKELKAEIYIYKATKVGFSVGL